MDQKMLSEKQAYAAMFFFLEEMYRQTGSDELGGLLGSLALTEDGSPADSGMVAEWSSAVDKAIQRGSAPLLEFL